MSSVRHVQWQSKEEWLQVFSWAYSSNCELRRKACYRIMAWRSRGKLPTALDAMCWLLDAVLQDENPPHSQDSRLREAYSVAIMRFVNVMTDPEQKGAFAISVEHLATRLGIPRWIVDLRHSIAHRNLPGIEPLRGAACVCLQWLRSHYWQDQVDRWRTAEQNLVDVFGVYVERASAVRRMKLRTGETDRSALSQLRHAVQQCVAECPLSATVQLLVEDSMLLMTNEQLDLVDRRFSVRPLAVVLKSGVSESIPSLSRHIVRFWKPLLHWLHELLPDTFCEKLVHAMLHGIIDCKIDRSQKSWRRQSLLASWVLVLMKASCQSKDKTSLLSLPCRLAVQELLALLLQGGGQGTGAGLFCHAIVNELLQHQPLPRNLVVPEVIAMAQACSQLAYFRLLLQHGKVEECSDSMLEMVDSLQHCSETVKVAGDLPSDSTTPGAYTQAQWASCPIGQLPTHRTTQVLDLPDYFDKPVSKVDHSANVSAQNICDDTAITPQEPDSTECHSHRPKRHLLASEYMSLRDTLSAVRIFSAS